MEYAVIGSLTLLFATLNMLPVIVSFFHIPPGDVFIGISHWYEDYFYYLSLIKQGQGGLWNATNWYTLESIPPSPGYWCYLLLGKINIVLGLQPWTLYNVTLFLSTVLFLVLTYMVIRRLIPKNTTLRLIAFVMALSATAFVGETGPVTFFFTPTLALNRLGGSIHQAWVNCLSLIFFLLIAELFRKRSKKIILISILTQIILFSLNPAASGITLVAFGVTGAFIGIMKKSWSWIKMTIVLEILFLLPILPIFLSYTNAIKHPYYQFTLLTYSKYFARATPLTFVLSMGIITVFACIGIPQWIKERKPLELFGLFYIIVPILLYFSPLPGIFNLPYERLLQPAMYAFIGTLGAYGIKALSYGMHKQWRVNQSISTLIFFLIFLVFSVVGLVSEIESRFKNFQDVYFLNAIHKSIYDGLSALGKEPYGAVFAPYTTSILTPVISGKPVYGAHRTLTINYEKKMKDIDAFLSLAWSQKEAKDFFKAQNIRYVVIPYGSDVQERIQAHYPFLKQQFSNPALSYYTTGD